MISPTTCLSSPNDQAAIYFAFVAPERPLIIPDVRKIDDTISMSIYPNHAWILPHHRCHPCFENAGLRHG